MEEDDDELMSCHELMVQICCCGIIWGYNNDRYVRERSVSLGLEEGYERPYQAPNVQPLPFPSLRVRASSDGEGSTASAASGEAEDDEAETGRLLPPGKGEEERRGEGAGSAGGAEGAGEGEGGEAGEAGKGLEAGGGGAATPPPLPFGGVGLHMTSSTGSLMDDDNNCPTCLEVYSEENPKILTKCNHHFHLGCIYEWLERSLTCPVCSRKMCFEELL